MLLDPGVVGTELPELTVDVERGALLFFAKATGQEDPVYRDLDAARNAGHRDLPVPPTFFFSLDLQRPDPFAWTAELGVDMRRVLHGEQCFVYHAMAYAGDTLTLASVIAEVFSKKAGALEFLVRKTKVTRSDGTEVADMALTLVVPNSEVRE